MHSELKLFSEIVDLHLQQRNDEIIRKIAMRSMFRQKSDRAVVSSEDDAARLEILTMRSKAHPWAFEATLEVFEYGLKNHKDPKISKHRLTNSFALTYVVAREESDNPHKTQLAKSLFQRLPLFYSFLSGEVSQLNLIFSEFGSRMRCTLLAS